MGNTGLHNMTPDYSAVHPHVHGEHLFRRHSVRIIIGSSPRTWGTLPLHDGASASPRFIPTYMGNTDDAAWARTSETVHPHVHGEHFVICGFDGGMIGSSPRTWGTLPGDNTRGRRRRFIPTYMGNTRMVRMMRLFPSVHPHVHGEHVRFEEVCDQLLGSSPRTWGTHQWPPGYHR